jgi:hypothetical protein
MWMQFLEYCLSEMNFCSLEKLSSVGGIRLMRSGSAIALLCCMMVAASVSGSAQPANILQPPSAFAGISDPAQRSRALFAEVAKVLTHPRCMNCHPATNRPTQGNDKHPHQPLATRETPCVTCHTDQNFTLHERASYQSIPGHPRWMAAPIEMAWEGKSVGEICRQIKDPDRNGGRNLSLLHEHLAHDDLVAWGWQPGAGRDPAPGSQALLGELVQAWIDTGALCP